MGAIDSVEVCSLSSTRMRIAPFDGWLPLRASSAMHSPNTSFPIISRSSSTRRHGATSSWEGFRRCSRPPCIASLRTSWQGNLDAHWILDVGVEAERAWPAFISGSRRVDGSTVSSTALSSSVSTASYEGRTILDDAELVGGVLVDAADPRSAARKLAQLLVGPRTDRSVVSGSGLDPDLIDVLHARFDRDPERVHSACDQGAAWVLGRRSPVSQDTWEVVASLPVGVALPRGLTRTTGETMISLASNARQRIRIAAPYVDEAGIGFLTDSIVAASRRGILVELFDPRSWEPARAAAAALSQAVASHGDSTRFRLLRMTPDAPFAHLKVMAVDASVAYIGSANITAAGLAGRNLELGVRVRGARVAVIDRILDLFRWEPSGRPGAPDRRD
jgi:phosphatidylserine/phosphatidylglycerophosphate/cardiolipin synthase-like enzyme